MKITSTLKSLTLLVSLSLIPSLANAKASKASNGDLVISKVYYAGTKDPNNKNYKADQYIEIFNNRHSVIDVSGLYIGLIETESSTAAYPSSYLSTTEAGDLKDKVICKQIFRIPATEPVLLEPGKSLVITNCAVDHTASNGHDLSGADFEVKTSNSGYSEHNDAVPGLEKIFSFNDATDFMNFTNAGPCGFVLIAAGAESQVNTAVAAPIYGYGKDRGNQYVAIPSYRVIDGVDILKKNASTDEVDTTTKRLVNSIDSGYVTTDLQNTWNGQTIYRRSAVVGDERVVLFDTNNSTTDWASSSDIQPRQYDTEAYGTTDTTIVIPATGFLPIKPSKPFFGPAALTIVNTNASSNAAITDLTYTVYKADTLMAMASSYILVGTPGTYTLKLSDANASISGSSNTGWTEESVYTETKAGRSVYKFIANDEKIGFQRDEDYAADSYKSCNFGEGEHLYITLTAKAIGYLETNLGMETGSLSFLQWNGPMPVIPEPVATPFFDFENNNMDLAIGQAGDDESLHAGDMPGKTITMGDVTLSVVDPEGASLPSRYFWVGSKGNTLNLFKNAAINLTAAEGRAITGVTVVFQTKANSLTASSGTYEEGTWTGNADVLILTAPATRYIYSINVTTDEANAQTVDIETVEAPQTAVAPKGIFDLTGRPVSDPTRGLYIIDGKITFVK